MDECCNSKEDRLCCIIHDMTRDNMTEDEYSEGKMLTVKNLCADPINRIMHLEISGVHRFKKSVSLL